MTKRKCVLISIQWPLSSVYGDRSCWGTRGGKYIQKLKTLKITEFNEVLFSRVFTSPFSEWAWVRHRREYKHLWEPIRIPLDLILCQKVLSASCLSASAWAGRTSAKNSWQVSEITNQFDGRAATLHKTNCRITSTSFIWIACLSPVWRWSKTCALNW